MKDKPNFPQWLRRLARIERGKAGNERMSELIKQMQADADRFDATADHIEALEAQLAALKSEPPADVPRPLRMAMFLETLQAMGGQSDASDYSWNWINAYCEAHEGQDPDTFNSAEQYGFTTVSHDSDTDQSTVYLTDAGRNAIPRLRAAALAAPQQIARSLGEAMGLLCRIKDRIERADRDGGVLAMTGAISDASAWIDTFLSRTPTEPEGMVLVPRQPTEAMLEAGDVGLSNAGVDSSTTEDAAYCWSAMIDAALQGTTRDDQGGE